ncbi:hypothetical protein CTRI78_v008364 [Colletotrichum trifolii]|uniref:Transcriptional regulator n=1 Tax=Colletotrichum trifolii TaxID=5466 RepID=A0A4R8R1A7_COLTR|nr:hypothetical protein CTRI78_v008364 [Colletotrichum trifolii]
MAPSDKKLETELLQTVREVFASDQDEFTVNLIRKRVETDLELDEGFFSSPKWKDRSKKLIKTLAAELVEDNAEPESKSSPAPEEKDETEDVEDAKPKKAGKRQSTETSPPLKRRKRAPLAKKADTVEDEGDEDDVNGEPKSKKAAPKKKSRPKVESDEEPRPVKPTSPEGRNGDAKRDESDSDALSSPPDSDDEKEGSGIEKSPDDKYEVSAKASVKEKEDDKPTEKESEGQRLVDDTTSELSDVIDEPPKPKRKKKEAGDGTKAPKAKKPTASSEDPDDVEIKKLQSQLVKCGIRKIWGIELKQCGDNKKARIKHLKEMLKEVGMDGRFSEAKAREIKERKELADELAAVTEMNANWGAGGRSSRSKTREHPSKMTKEDVPGEIKGEEEEEDDEDNGAAVSSRARGKARADLAFLGDDDEESD